MGKPIREARGEVARGVAILDFFAGEGQRPLGELYEQSATGNPVYTVRRPVGVTGLITPWNFPAAIPVWKAAPALAYGNAVVLKLALDSPRTGLHIAECFAEAGLPAGVLNILTGPGATAGAALVRDHHVEAVSFTGSVAVGASVRDEVAGRGARVQLELGGQNPLIVAVRREARLTPSRRRMPAPSGRRGRSALPPGASTFRTASTTRFATASSHASRAGRSEIPTDPATEVGPVVNERQFDDVLAAIERGRREGGSVIAGGERLDRDGYFIAPTVFENVGDESYLSCEEVFGPVTTLYRFSELDEALDARTTCASGSPRRSTRRTSRPCSSSSRRCARGSCTSTRRRPVRRRTCRSAARKGSGFGPARARPRRARVLHRPRHGVPRCLAPSRPICSRRGRGCCGASLRLGAEGHPAGPARCAGGARGA